MGEKIIIHYTPEGTREFHPRVHELRHPRLGKPRRRLQIMDTRMGFPCPFRSVVIDSIIPWDFFYTPVFRRDVLWYGVVRPGLRPYVRPVSVRPISALFSYMLWHIELKFCTWLCFNVLQIKFECHYFASIF